MPSKLEHIKATSAGLSGTLGDELHSDDPSFSADAGQLLKFHGIYQQDDRDVRRERARSGLGKDYRCMVRAALPGGRMTVEQYLALDAFADEFADGTMRITTRQGLQYHFVVKSGLRELVAGMNERLVTTLAACGDVVRNVMSCPAPLPDRVAADLDGVADEIARATKPRVASYWQLFVDGERAASASRDVEPDPLYGPTWLPRKFKIAVAFPGDNCVDVATQDIGVVPEVVDGGVVAYTLIVGGGLGMSHNKPATFPRLGDPLCRVAPDELIDTIRAIIGIQRDHGDRDDRKHARFKYLVHEWGVDRVAAELSRRLDRELDAPTRQAWTATSDHLGWSDQGDGRWTLGVRVASGRIADVGEVRLRTALRTAALHAADVRFTPNQDVLLTGVATDDRATVDAVLAEHGVPTVASLGRVTRHALACPALPTCGLAIAEAERVMPELTAELERTLTTVGAPADDIHVRVTGCPNGCARPYATEVGVVGRGASHYALFLGGSHVGTRLGTRFADRVPFQEIPQRLSPLLDAWSRERRDGERFGDWCARVGVDALARRFPQAALADRAAG